MVCLTICALVVLPSAISAQWTATSTLTKQTTTTNDVLIGGDSLAGAGTKCFWDNGTGAFRGGIVTGNKWDTINLGDYSFGFGRDVEASGDNGAIAMGYGSSASGVQGATALGLYTTASGNSGATALGSFTRASGFIGATALGYQTNASGDFGATALGYATNAAGDNSICIGSGVAINGRLINSINQSLMIGFNSTVPTLFVSESLTDSTHGYVGIGTTTPTHDLHVAGDIAVAGQIVHPSDKRLKTNIANIKNGLSLINQLSPKTYNHKTEQVAAFGLSNKPQYGLIAQEVEKVIPEIVIQKALVGEDGEIYKGLDYEKLIPILVQALKEAHAKITNLESNESALNAKVELQQNQINQILNKLNTEEASK